MSRLVLDGWQVVIGIETHAQIKSRQKLFSLSSTSLLSEPPNTRLNTFDAAFPGTLPKINPKCVLLGLRAALALNCTIENRSSFDRKHYFYSDLPSGYQITQYYTPFASNGRLTLPKLKIPVRIKQIQLEQDTAKSISDEDSRTTHIDLNRAGTGLLEIVTEPDLRSTEEAAEYVRTLQALLRALGVSDGNMETGSLRCDVNVSINRPGEPMGTRCEIKNLASVRYMVAAINHEIKRQREILTSSSPSSSPPVVPQETRGFDTDRWETYKLRSKEDAPDYRYMPDPNLGILHISQGQIQDVHRNLPPLPNADRARLIEVHGPKGVAENDIDILLGLDADRDIGYDGEVGGGDDSAVAYFESLCSQGRNSKVVMNWIVHSLLGELSALNLHFSSRPSTTELGELIDLVVDGVVTRSSGRLLLQRMLKDRSTGRISVRQLAGEMELISLGSSTSNATSSSAASSDGDLGSICSLAIAAMPSEAAAVRAGNRNVINKIVGRVMRETRGRADAESVRSMVEKLLLSKNP